MCICQKDIRINQNEFDEESWNENGFKDKDRFFPKIMDQQFMDGLMIVVDFMGDPNKVSNMYL